MNKAIIDIFTKASTNAIEQRSLLLKLKKLYQKSNPDKFREAFVQCCLKVTKYEYKRNNNQAERCLKFAAVFCGNCCNAEEVDEVDQFVVEVLDYMLQGINSSQTNFRYYICKTIRLIIDQITVHLRDDICDKIQEALFKRLIDYTAAVREQAVLALMRLQRPDIPNCPVIEKYIERINSDPNPMIRKVLIQKIAMTRRSLPVIYNSIYSVDAAVRSAAYLRCSLQGPSVFEIEQRQFLVTTIAYDNHEPNRDILERRLWPRWLDVNKALAVKAASKTALESSKRVEDRTTPLIDATDACILLLQQLRLDENVDQLHKTYLAYKVVLNVHFKITQITDLIKALRLDTKKLIPMEYLTLESAFFWKYLFKHVHRNESLNEHADEVVAELTGFCEYIDKYIKKAIIDTSCEEFTWLPNQHILLQLLEMVTFSDLNDDFGRERLSLLLSDILQNVKYIHDDVLTIILRIYCQIEKDFKNVCERICEIMTNIMRPYQVIPLHDTIRQERDFTLAKLKFTLTMAEDSHADAMESKNYLLANDCHKEVMSLREQIAAVPNDAQLLAEHEKQQRMNGRQGREKASKDPEKHLRCCNMLLAIVKLCHQRRHEILPVLYTAKTELVDGLISNEYDYHSDELLARALEIITYYGLMDKDVAEIAMITLSTPIISYRLLPRYNISIVLATLTGFTYFLVKYGVEILQNNENAENHEKAPLDNLPSQSSDRSRLERSTCMADVSQTIENIDLENIPLAEFQAIILEMLDDENQTLNIHAAICITTLLEHNIGVNVAVISKILLKWFTPETYETNPKMLYILSTGISRLGDTNIDNIGAIMEETAMCILRNIIEAPVDSSLYLCNLPKCLQFLASITMMAEPNHSEIHRNVAQKIIPQLSSDIADMRSKEIYSKFLSYMDAPFFDMEAVRTFDELLENIETGGHKATRANIAKYLSKLRNTYNGSTVDTLTTSTQGTMSITSSNSHVTTCGLSSTNIPPAKQPAEIRLSRISEAVSASPSRSNIFADRPLECSTPVHMPEVLVPVNQEIGEVSYHISEPDTDPESNNVAGTHDCVETVNAPEQDVVISPTDSERNSTDAERNKENNSINNRPVRRRTLSNKRVYNSENDHSSQDSESSTTQSHRGHPQKKRKLSLSLNIPKSVTNDLPSNSSSSQGSTDSSSSRKRGRPSKLTRQISILQNITLPRRVSVRNLSSSIEQNGRVEMIVNADVHHAMNGFLSQDSGTSSPTSSSPCNRPRKKLRMLPRSSLVNGNQTSRQLKTRNDIHSQLQSIENNFDAIDIVTASSSSEPESSRSHRVKRRIKKKMDSSFHY